MPKDPWTGVVQVRNVEHCRSYVVPMEAMPEEQKGEEEKDERSRKDAKRPSPIKPVQIDRSRGVLLTQQDAGDQVSRNDEENVNTGWSVMVPENTGCMMAFCHVPQHDHADRNRPEAVKRRDAPHPPMLAAKNLKNSPFALTSTVPGRIRGTRPGTGMSQPEQRG